MQHFYAVTVLAPVRAALYNHPMRQYERYLCLHLLWPTVLITASLTGIIWLTQMLRFLDFMLNRGLSIGDFLTLTGLMLPSLLLLLIPIALCIAVIYTYNRLTVESELVVLNAVGVSTWQMTRPVLLVGGVCVLLCYALGFYLTPLANQKFQDIRTFFRDKYASVLLEEQVFSNPIDGVTVFVRERDANNNLFGVMLHDSRDPNQTITMLADRGRMEQTESGPRFYLQQGVRQTLKQGRVSWLTFDEYAIDIAFYGRDVQRKRSPNEMTIGQLWATPGATELQIAANRVEVHQRLTWPLFALTLPLFALAVMFSSEFNRRGQWRRMVTAAAGTAVILMMYFGLRNLAIKQSWLGGGLYGMVIVIALASAHLLISGRLVRFAPRLRVPAAAEVRP